MSAADVVAVVDDVDVDVDDAASSVMRGRRGDQTNDDILVGRAREEAQGVQGFEKGEMVVEGLAYC